MEEYASFLQTAQREWCTDLGEGQEKSPLKYPVTVAVIDDGIDVHDPMVQSRIIDGRSFCSRDEEQNLNQPYYVSGGGHGTAMAKLICKVCPNVQLYILRLDEYVMEAGKRQITAKSAAKVCFLFLPPQSLRPHQSLLWLLISPRRSVRQSRRE